MTANVHTICTCDEAGAFHVDVQVGRPGKRLRVVIAWEDDVDAAGAAKTTDALGWPAGFFERFPGILADDPIERGDQGVAEERPSLEPA